MSEKTDKKCFTCGKELGNWDDKPNDENWAVCQIVGKPPNEEERYYCRSCLQPTIEDTHAGS